MIHRVTLTVMMPNVAGKIRKEGPSFQVDWF